MWRARLISCGMNRSRSLDVLCPLDMDTFRVMSVRAVLQLDCWHIVRVCVVTAVGSLRTHERVVDIDELFQSGARS